MGGTKIDHSFEVNEDHVDWLTQMASKYDLPDEAKALRVLISYAMVDGDLDSIFSEIRCQQC
jgi:hypothetical protein